MERIKDIENKEVVSWEALEIISMRFLSFIDKNSTKKLIKEETKYFNKSNRKLFLELSQNFVITATLVQVALFKEPNNIIKLSQSEKNANASIDNIIGIIDFESSSPDEVFPLYEDKKHKLAGGHELSDKYYLLRRLCKSLNELMREMPILKDPPRPKNDLN